MSAFLKLPLRDSAEDVAVNVQHVVCVDAAGTGGSYVTMLGGKVHCVHLDVSKVADLLMEAGSRLAMGIESLTQSIETLIHEARHRS